MRCDGTHPRIQEAFSRFISELEASLVYELQIGQGYRETSQIKSKRKRNSSWSMNKIQDRQCWIIKNEDGIEKKKHTVTQIGTQKT